MPGSFSDLSTGLTLAAFLAAAAVIGGLGTLMTRLADAFADRTKFGEAVTGAILLGASTSLSGIVTSVWTASTGHVELAVTNAVGGIAAQTAFLVIADIAHRRANLEHAAASATNLTQLVFLILLLTVPLLVFVTPPVTLYGIHPASLLLVLVYMAGVRSAAQTTWSPMWRPQETDDTRTEEGDADAMPDRSLSQILLLFALCAAVVSVAGWVIAQSGVQLSTRLGISESVVGALMTAVATSLPELVTTIAAARRGALQLAVGGIIGGNTFDILFLSLSDAAYRPGSIYHEMNDQAVFWIAVSLLMSGVLLLGLLRRERHGIGNIGFESVSLLGIYAGAVVLQIFIG